MLFLPVIAESHVVETIFVMVVVIIIVVVVVLIVCSCSSHGCSRCCSSFCVIVLLVVQLYFLSFKDINATSFAFLLVLIIVSLLSLLIL